MNRFFQVSAIALLVGALSSSSLAGSAPTARAAENNKAQVTLSASSLSLPGATDPRWISSGKLLVTVYDEDGATDYLVDTNRNKAEPIIEGVSGIVVSADGALGAYAAESGYVYLVDLETKTETVLVGTDTEKFELQFSADGKTLYYIEGSKAAVIVALDLETKKTTKIVDDKIENKMNLNVSDDGKRFLYAVETVGKTTVDSNASVDADALEIDVSNANTHLYFYDKNMTKPGPYALLKGTDNKTSLSFWKKDNALYVSSDAEDPNARSVLKSLNLYTNATYKFFNLTDVIKAEAQGDAVYVLGAKRSGKLQLYRIAKDTGLRKLLLSTDEAVTGFTVSPDGDVLVTVWGDEEESFFLLRDEQLVPVLN